MIRYRFLLIPLLAALAARPAAGQDKVRIAELSPRAEAAIDKGLRYLVKTQNRDGSWDQQNPVGVTSLALMAFMVKGYFPDQEPYGDNLTQGIDYLLRASRDSPHGYMGKSMYDHGLATLALSEAWGESARNNEIREALKKAVEVIVKSQSAAGGWRYQPTGTDQDVSVTVMQVVALASAREAGILVPDDTIQNALRYLKSCQEPNGRFGYRRRGDSIGAHDNGFARTAAGVISLQLCGERDSPEAKRGLEYLRNLPDSKFNPRHGWFFYAQYYAIQAMYQAGEKDYQTWYPRVRDALVEAQNDDGSWVGGIPTGIRTIVATDRDSYCTPTAILVLGVPYRFLPIYQR